MRKILLVVSLLLIAKFGFCGPSMYYWDGFNLEPVIEITNVEPCWYCQKEIIKITKENRIIYEEETAKFNDQLMHKECYETFLRKLKGGHI
jgi:hypothetical protein